MPEGPKDALNKWSRKITQPKSQGASQVTLARARPRFLVFLFFVFAALFVVLGVLRERGMGTAR